MMKSKKIIALLVGLCSFAFFSFTPNKWGGEGFRIYLDDKLVTEKYGSDILTANTITLNETTAQSKISVQYFHCGKVGKNRIVTLKDMNDKIVKEWKFLDDKSPAPLMHCRVTNLSHQLTGKTRALKLYYSSTELQTERLLAKLEMKSSKSIAK